MTEGVGDQAGPEALAGQGFTRLARTSVVFVLGAVTGKLIGLVLLPILARELTPTGFGETDVLLSLGSALTAALTLGLDVAVLRLWFDQPDSPARRSLVSSAYVIVTLVTVVAGLVILVEADTIGQVLGLEPGLVPAIRLLSIVGVAGTVLTVSQTVLRAQERAGWYAAIQGGVLLCYAVLAIVLLTVWRRDATAVVAAWAVALGVFAVIGLLLVRRAAIGRPTGALGRGLLRLGLPLAPAVAIALVGESVNRIVLLNSASAADVAYYTVAARFAAVAGLAVGGFQLAWQPRAYALGTGDPARTRLASDSLWIIAIVCALVTMIAVGSPEMLVIVTGPAYEAAMPALAFSLLAVIGTALYLVLSLPSALAKATQDLGLAMGVSVVAAVGLNVLFVPLWRSTGTAVAVALGQFISVALVWRIGFWRVKLPLDWAWIATLVLATSGVVLVSLLADPALPVRILLGLAVLSLVVRSLPVRSVIRAVAGLLPARSLGDQEPLR